MWLKQGRTAGPSTRVNYMATPPAALLTQVFWDEPVFTPIVVLRDKLSRSARVTVLSYQEQGE